LLHRAVGPFFQGLRTASAVAIEERIAVAHKKGQGSTENGRDSNPQFRGVRLYGGQRAKTGSIILTQCGTRWKAGHLVQRTKDFTLMALVEGTVRFRGRTVDVIPADPSAPRMARDTVK